MTEIKDEELVFVELNDKDKIQNIDLFDNNLIEHIDLHDFIYENPDNIKQFMNCKIKEFNVFDNYYVFGNFLYVMVSHSTLWQSKEIGVIALEKGGKEYRFYFNPEKITAKFLRGLMGIDEDMDNLIIGKILGGKEDDRMA